MWILSEVTSVQMIWKKKWGQKYSDIHLYQSNFLQNPYFKYIGILDLVRVGQYWQKPLCYHPSLQKKENSVHSGFLLTNFSA